MGENHAPPRATPNSPFDCSRHPLLCRYCYLHKKERELQQELSEAECHRSITEWKLETLHDSDNASRHDSISLRIQMLAIMGKRNDLKLKLNVLNEARTGLSRRHRHEGTEETEDLAQWVRSLRL